MHYVQSSSPMTSQQVLFW